MAVSTLRRALAAVLLFGLAPLVPAQQLQIKKLANLEPMPMPSATPDKLPDDARLRIGSLRFRDGGHVFGAAVSPDGKYVALASQNAYVRLMELDTGKEVRRFTMPGGFRNNPIAFARDGKTLIGQGHQNTILWNVEDGSVAKTVPLTGNNNARSRETSFHLSADGKFLASAAADYNAQNGKVTLFDLGTEQPPREFSTLHNNSLFVALSADGKRMLTWGYFYDRAANANGGNQENHNGTIQLWDTATGKEIKRLKSESVNLFGCAFSPDGKKIVSAGNGVVQLWDTESGNAERRFAARASQGQQIAFSPDGKSFAVSSNRDATVQAWELATGKRLGTYEGPQQTIPSGMVYRPDGKLIAWGISGTLIHVWEATTGKRLTGSTGHSAPVTGLLFTDGGKTLVSTAQDGKMLSWEPETGREKSAVDLYPSDENGNRRYYRGPRGGGSYNNGGTMSSVFSPNGKYMVGTNNDYGTASVYELPSGLEIFALSPPGQYYGNGATVFSPDSTKVAVLIRNGGPQRTGIPIWDLDSGLPLTPLKVQNGDFVAGAFSPDGKLFVSAAMNYSGAGQSCDISVWDLATGKEKSKLQQVGYCSSMIFLDDRRFLAASPSGWRMHDALQGKEIGAFEGTMSQVTSTAALSPDGRLLALGVTVPETYSREGQRLTGVQSKVVVWEIASGAIRHEFLGHEGPVGTLAFSPDSQVLASGGQDTTILVWELHGKRNPEAPALNHDELAAAWKALDGKSGKDAETAMRKMLDRPTDAVKFLETELKPTEGTHIGDDEVRKLLVNLEASRFAVRERASKQLESLGRVVLKQLSEMRSRSLAFDLERRVDKLIETIDRVDDSALYLRSLRGIEVLERMNTPEAKAHLQRLAEGASGAIPTNAALAALKRLER